MRVISTNPKNHKQSLPTTKNCVVIDKYKDATAKTVASRMKKIKKLVVEIIEDEEKRGSFLEQLEKELYRRPGISEKEIIKRARLGQD